MCMGAGAPSSITFLWRNIIGGWRKKPLFQKRTSCCGMKAKKDCIGMILEPWIVDWHLVGYFWTWHHLFGNRSQRPSNTIRNKWHLVWYFGPGLIFLATKRLRWWEMMTYYDGLQVHYISNIFGDFSFDILKSNAVSPPLLIWWSMEWGSHKIQRASDIFQFGEN